MRQILSFIGITALVLVLSACGSAGTTAPATETAIVPVTGDTATPEVMATDTSSTPLETATTEASTTVEATSAATADATTMGSETPASSSGTATAGGLGIKLADIKTAMMGTSQFEFSDGNVNGQPASIAKLTNGAASAFPTLAAGFSTAFIGDPANLSEIKITLPRTGDNPSLEENVRLVTLLLSRILPANVQSQFMAWMNQNFSDLPVGSSKDTTVENFKFTLSRTSTDMVLDVVPAAQ